MSLFVPWRPHWHRAISWMASTTKRVRFAIAATTLGVLALVIVLLLGRGGAPTRSTTAGPAATDDPAGGVGTSSKGPRPILAPRKGTGAHSLAGWVRGSDGETIAMAQITATMELGPGVDGMAPNQPEAAVIVANSGADGSFLLEGLDPGRYRLSIEGQGLVTAELRFVDAPGVGLVILVSREVAVRGRLLGAAAPLSGVRVFLRSEQRRSKGSVRLPTMARLNLPGWPKVDSSSGRRGPGRPRPPNGSSATANKSSRICP